MHLVKNTVVINDLLVVHYKVTISYPIHLVLFYLLESTFRTIGSRTAHNFEITLTSLVGSVGLWCLKTTFNYLSAISWRVSFIDGGNPVGPSWSWAYGSWICNYLPKSCELKTRSWRGVLDTTLCDKVCQWHVGGFLGILRFPPQIKLTTTTKLIATSPL